MSKMTKKTKNSTPGTGSVKPQPARPEPTKVPLSRPEPTPSRVEPMKPAMPLRATEPASPALAHNRNSEPAKVPSPQPLPPAKTEPAKAAVPAPGRVSLEILRPGAHEVFVAGSFNGWKPEPTRLLDKGSGRWVRDLTINPGRYEYLFVVDGQWLPDPNAKESVANPFGGRNSVLVVAE